MSSTIITSPHQVKAMILVDEYIKERLKGSAIAQIPYSIFPVWFCKTLQNWKCLVATTLLDSMYYEVTYDGDKQETYIDAYTKVENVCIPDHEPIELTEEARHLCSTFCPEHG